MSGVLCRTGTNHERPPFGTRVSNVNALFARAAVTGAGILGIRDQPQQDWATSGD